MVPVNAASPVDYRANPSAGGEVPPQGHVSRDDPYPQPWQATAPWPSREIQSYDVQPPLDTTAGILPPRERGFVA